MNASSKGLPGIFVGIGLLIPVAFVAALIRPGPA